MTKFYLSTIAADAVRTAKANGFGLELAEYSTVWKSGSQMTNRVLRAF